MDAVVRGTLLGRLICLFVVNILQISSGCTLHSYSQDLCGQKKSRFFRRLMLLVSFSIVSTFEDMFSYPSVLMNFFFKL
jgi:hypothetical protein